MSEHPSIQKRRLRLLYSLKDIQLALSSAAFLAECEPDIAISKVELRRFKCYETTAIIAYARPFSEASDGFPKLSMKMIGVRLDVEEQKLHDQLIGLRNQVIAHSDPKKMRMAVRVTDLDIGNGESWPYINATFDEGLDFVGHQPVTQLMTLFRKVLGGIYTKLVEDAKINSDLFAIQLDHLNPAKSQNS